MMIVEKLRLPSCTTSINQLEKLVDLIINRFNISPDKFPDILISLTEAVNNAIIHGNQQDQSKYVDITIRRTQSGIAFLVTDQGNGFNPQKLPDPTLPENITCCGGRGVFLMKQLADAVLFHNDGRTVEMQFTFN